MTYVVSLVDFRPPARYDAVPWSRAVIEESGVPDEGWTQIDDQALSPVDADPAVPATRNLTTTLAALASGWYRVQFKDAASNVSSWSDPVRHSSLTEPLPPTPDDVRNLSELIADRFPVGGADSERKLRNIVYMSIALVQGMTWRLIDPTLGSPPGKVFEAVPVSLVPIAIRAVTLMAEQQAVTGSLEFVASTNEGRRLRSISAGPWSESYFAPGELVMKNGRPQMSTNPELDTCLWLLATEDAREEFITLTTGQQPPAAVITTIDYRRMGAGYGSWPSRLGAGPDGW